MYQEMEVLTRELVKVASVNGTDGERNIGEKIESVIREMPYFKAHPEYVFVEPLKNDPLGRRNVLALFRGEKEENNKTLIWHGHTDTVGVEDYKALKEYAFDCEELEKQLHRMELSEEMKEDLESGDYLFGRGACDMKSGDAVFLVLLRKLSENPKAFSGNILVSFQPVEENLHTGVMEASELLLEIKERFHLTYVLAINNDYICPLYAGDPKRYVYLGSVGKLLPCFYIQGKETHVGQCFEGFDASLAAVELVRQISLNAEFCDEYHGEYTLPPSVLKVKDLKERYDVQTAYASFVYFNYFVHNEGVEKTTEKLKRAATDAMQRVEEHINTQYQKYCEYTKDTFHEYHYEKKVYTYEELKNKVREEFGEEFFEDFPKRIKKLEEAGIDKREIPITLIQHMLSALKENEPVMVLYYAAPYCPHNTLKEEVTSERMVIEKLQKTVKATAQETGEEYQILQFFPSLTDSSYLKIDDSKESLSCLKANFPGIGQLYDLPFENIKKLNIPAVDFGRYGKDAHKWPERVYKPYSFGVLPKLILNATEEFLKVN